MSQQQLTPEQARKLEIKVAKQEHKKFKREQPAQYLDGRVALAAQLSKGAQAIGFSGNQPIYLLSPPSEINAENFNWTTAPRKKAA